MSQRCWAALLGCSCGCCCLARVAPYPLYVIARQLAQAALGAAQSLFEQLRTFLAELAGGERAALAAQHSPLKGQSPGEHGERSA